jgi:uncharacterized protein with HEPN domain
MSDILKEERVKLQNALLHIEEIEKSLLRHGSLSSTLNDFEGKNSILMNILQIGENLKKVSADRIAKEIIDGAYYTRNVIAHDYEGVNLAIIERIVRDDLPALKKTILEQLQ